VTTDQAVVRQTRPSDFASITAMSEAVYPGTPPWMPRQLASHLAVFPEGQFVAVERGEVVGMAASLIVLWDDYDVDMNWRDFTNEGMFTNHDPVHGRTLYGAEVMVRPDRQGHGLGGRLYAARRALVERLGLLRIRAGARLRGYSRYARQMSAEQYTIEVVQGRIVDPTLTFQLRQGFAVLAVVSGYLRHDAESLGYAALIEWINNDVATDADTRGRDRRFARLSA
jgi:GNAT superfamily N-acetyltransferase